MASYLATTRWSRGDAVFSDNRYSRAHTWSFDGGVTVPASSSPHVVPVPLSDARAVDPEEAFVAAVSSCHLLWFLGLARQHGYVVDSYEDKAVGVMTKNAGGKLFVSTVTLRPRIVFAGDKQPDAAALERLHHEAHEECFIAHSIRSEVRIEPR